MQIVHCASEIYKLLRFNAMYLLGFQMAESRRQIFLITAACTSEIYIHKNCNAVYLSLRLTAFGTVSPAGSVGTSALRAEVSTGHPCPVRKGCRTRCFSLDFLITPACSSEIYILQKVYAVYLSLRHFTSKKR